MSAFRPSSRGAAAAAPPTFLWTKPLLVPQQNMSLAMTSAPSPFMPHSGFLHLPALTQHPPVQAAAVLGATAGQNAAPSVAAASHCAFTAGHRGSGSGVGVGSGTGTGSGVGSGSSGPSMGSGLSTGGRGTGAAGGGGLGASGLRGAREGSRQVQGGGERKLGARPLGHNCKDQTIR